MASGGSTVLQQSENFRHRQLGREEAKHRRCRRKSDRWKTSRSELTEYEVQEEGVIAALWLIQLITQNKCCSSDCLQSSKRSSILILSYLSLFTCGLKTSRGRIRSSSFNAVTVTGLSRSHLFSPSSYFNFFPVPCGAINKTTCLSPWTWLAC